MAIRKKCVGNYQWGLLLYESYYGLTRTKIVFRPPQVIQLPPPTPDPATLKRKSKKVSIKPEAETAAKPKKKK